MNSSNAHDRIKICFLEMDDRVGQSLRLFFEQRMADYCTVTDESAAEAVILNGDGARAEEILQRENKLASPRPVLVTAFVPENFADRGLHVLAKPVTAEMFKQAIVSLHDRLRPAPPPVEFTGDAVMAVADSLPSALDVAQAAVSTPEPVRTVVVSEAEASVRRKVPVAGELAATERHFYIGSMPDVDLDDQESLAKVSYDPSFFLLGHVRRAYRMGIEHACVVRLSNPAFQQIEIYPFAQRAVCSASSATLFGAGRLPISEREVNFELLRDAPHFPPEGIKAERLDSLIWRLGLWASRGRLPAGTALDMPVRIRLWPNLTRLQIPPHAVRILGLWSRRPTSLRETTRLLGIPQRYVFGVYSACAAIEVIQLPEDKDQAVLAQVAAPPLVEHKKRGLFRMLLSKLLSATDEGKSA